MMNSYKTMLALLCGCTIASQSLALSAYEPPNYDARYVLRDVTVLPIEGQSSEVDVKSVGWAAYFSGATMYHTKQFFRIVPAGNTDAPKVNYIDIKRNGTGIGSSSAFGVTGRSLYINKFRSFFEKKPYQIEIEAEVNSLSDNSSRKNIRSRILLKAYPLSANATGTTETATPTKQPLRRP